MIILNIKMEKLNKLTGRTSPGDFIARCESPLSLHLQSTSADEDDIDKEDDIIDELSAQVANLELLQSVSSKKSPNFRRETSNSSTSTALTISSTSTNSDDNTSFSNATIVVVDSPECKKLMHSKSECAISDNDSIITINDTSEDSYAKSVEHTDVNVSSTIYSLSSDSFELPSQQNNIQTEPETEEATSSFGSSILCSKISLESGQTTDANESSPLFVQPPTPSFADIRSITDRSADQSLAAMDKVVTRSCKGGAIGKCLKC